MKWELAKEPGCNPLQTRLVIIQNRGFQAECLYTLGERQYPRAIVAVAIDVVKLLGEIIADPAPVLGPLSLSDQVILTA
jgi:hypothetical protein